MQFKKRLIAILLAVLLLFTTMPLEAFFAMAADINSSDLIWGNNQGITRAQWLHNLVVVFEMEADEDALPDNYFSDLSESHKYYEDVLMAVEFGVVDVGAGYDLQPDALVTRDFAAYTLNFCLGYQVDEGVHYTFTDFADSVHADSAQIALNRCWFALIDGEFQPQTIVTKAEVKFMLEDAVAILKKDIIDPYYDSTFTFRDDVIVLEDGTEITEDEECNVVVTDCPATIAVGDKFVAFFGGIPRGYKAVAVMQIENKTVITTEELSLQDTFKDLDMQGVTDVESMEFIPIEDTQLEMIEESGPVSFFAIKKIPTLQATRTFDFGDGISVSVTVKMKDLKIEYDVNTKRAYVKMIGDTEITYKSQVNLVNNSGKTVSLDLCKAVVPGVGGFTLSANFKLSGTASGTVKGKLVAGIECTYGEDIRAIKNFAQSECSSRAEATASAGVKVTLGFTDMPVVKAYLYAEVGMKATVSVTAYSEGIPNTCGDFSAYLYAKYGAKASVEFFGREKSLEEDHDIFNATNSPVRLVYHYEDGRQTACCTRDIQTDNAGTGSFGSGEKENYYTNADSQWSGDGWSVASSAYGVNAAGESVRLYDYSLNDNKEAIITKYYGSARSINIPETIDGYTVVEIGTNAFYNSNMKHVTISNTVTTIGEDAFYNCYKLIDVNISNSVVTIDYHAFYGSYNIIGFWVDAENCNYSSDAYGVLFNKDKTKLIKAPPGISGTYTIPSSVTTIGDEAFHSCDDMIAVIIPDSVTTIGVAAFLGCGRLTAVDIPESVTSISTYLFCSCDNLTSVTIPNSVTSMGNYVFWGCESLSDVTIPNSVTTIGDYCFLRCISLDGIWVDVDNPNYSSDDRGVLFNKDKTQLIQAPGAISGSYTVPSNVATISEYAFAYCKELITATIFDSVAIIGKDAFYRCDNLDEVVFFGTKCRWEQIDLGEGNDALLTGELQFKKGEHSFTNYISNNDATADADGTKTAKCDQCDATDTIIDSGTKLQRLNGWEQRDGKWYYYKENIRQIGWIQDGKTWYYMNTEGVMQTGWQRIGGTWYYFNTSGAMVTGWLKSGASWYYLQPTGAMATGWCSVGGVYYYFDANGYMQTGWLKSGDTWYYLQSSGAMKTGWMQDGGTWYYMNSSGAMVTGWLKQGSTWYYLNTSGAMLTGWLQQGSTWYYFNTSGVMATGSMKIGNKTYNFNSSGACLNP